MSDAAATERVGARLSAHGVGVELGGRPILKDVELDIDPGEFVCLLGPSGSGKSTLLNAFAGFLEVTQGEIMVGSDGAAKVGFVFQNSDVLFPWLTVRENVGYSQRVRRVGRAARRELEDGFLDMVGLRQAADLYPRQLSGGMRQRIQIARVLADKPTVVLMDEPFGALDAQTRSVMQRELVNIWQRTRPTIVFVTHDISEAILLSDRVVTLTAGPAARIKNVHVVDLPRPHDETSPAYIALREQLRADIDAEVSRALEQQGLVFSERVAS